MVDRVLRRTVDQIVDAVPGLPALDAPVPQMVDQLLSFLTALDSFVPEQVVDVPKISCSPCPSRSRVPEPQSAEQLVEVPTVLSPTRIALQIAEQVVDTPVPRGRGQGSLPGQSSVASHSSGKRISEQTVEQIVDFPFSVGGLGQGSSSSAGPADEDFTKVFRTFPRDKKVRLPQPSRVRACPPVSADGPGRLMRQREVAKHEAKRQETLRLAAEALDRADKRRKKKKKRRKNKLPKTSS